MPATETLHSTRRTTAPGTPGLLSVDLTLAALEGSDKQIAWATDLRRSLTIAVLDAIAPAPGVLEQMTAKGLTAAALAGLAAWAADPSAKAWIDRKALDTRALTRAALVAGGYKL